MKEVKVGLASCGIVAGGLEVYDRFSELIDPEKDQVILKKTGCNGMCFREVLVEVIEDSKRRTLYGEVTPKKVDGIVKEHLREGKVISKWVVKDEEEFLKRQKRIVLHNCGKIDPLNIEDYLARDGYKALKKVLAEMTPDQAIEEVSRAGLRGRGGGGFLAGRKWRTCREASGDIRYVICNADEGDPGAYMDRSMLEGDPHSVLEGMVIGAYAISYGVSPVQGFIYVRHEYPLALKHFSRAVEQAREYGFLGKDILGKAGFNFDIQISRGGGAFVCGESSALMASLEGRIGEPRPKHIHTVEKGLYGKPSNLNNVETWANVPLIITRGAKWFSSIGTEGSKGTKIFSLVGKINNTGLIEVPMGISLREIIYDIGGGIPAGKKFKAVQTGGPSGGCIPESLIDTSVDFDRLTELGSMMGSGGMIVMDQDTCMVDMARYFVKFLTEESCGKCVPCRVGLDRMLDILTDITEGNGRQGDIELLEELGEVIKETSLCALGKTAANPVLSTIKYFREEYEAHIRDHRCPAGVCKALITFTIDEDKCNGCGVCLKNCPEEAISGEKKEPHKIAQEKCIKCGLCRELCKFDAVIVS